MKWNNQIQTQIINEKVQSPTNIQLPSIEKLKNNLSIVITTKDFVNVTKDAVKSLKETVHIPYNLIFVDDMSTEKNYEEMIKSFAMPSVYFKQINAESLCQSWNTGIQTALSLKDEYIVILNNDIILEEGWLEYLFEAFQFKTDKYDTALAGSNQLGMDGKIQVCGSWGWGGYVFPPELWIIDAQNNIEEWNYKEEDLKFYGFIINAIHSKFLLPSIFPVSDTTGGCFMISKNTVDKIGMFDNNIAYSFDEYEYMHRCWSKDMMVVQSMNSKFRHLGGTSRMARGLIELLLQKSHIHNKPYMHPSYAFNRKMPPHDRRLIFNNKVKPLLKELNIQID
jgi:glycosyltransferase involved in cell wall biosynthesis